MTKDEALKMAIDYLGGSYEAHKVRKACQEALEQPSVAELNDEYLRDTYVQGLSQPTQEPYQCHWVEKGKGHCERNKRMGFADDYGQPAQEPIVIGIDFAKNQWKQNMIKFLKEKQICAFDNNKIIMQSWIDELENK